VGTRKKKKDDVSQTDIMPKIEEAST
jgi:hypothetical protein